MYFLGIHLDGSAALIRKKSRQSKTGIEWVKKFDVKRLDSLHPLLQEKPYLLVTGLSASDLVLRVLKLQLKSKREILAALPFQIEGLLPTPIEQLLLKPIIYKDEVLVFAAKKTALEEHIALCAAEEIQPDVVSGVPLALWRFAREFLPDRKNLLVFHFGERETTLIAIEEGRLKLSYSHFQELERTIAFAKKKCPLLTEALVTGEAPKEALSSHFELLQLPAEAQEMGEHAVALGLALDAAARDAGSLQLRQGEFAPLKAREKRKKIYLRYLAACAASFLLAFGGTQLALNQQQKKILSQLPEASGMSAEEAIAAAEKKLSEDKRALSSRSSLPKVSDLLAWLSTDPIFSPKEGKLIVDSVHYQLVPDTHKPSTTRAKVDLQISFSAPSAGRYLREALQAEQTFIDQKEEVKWAGEHNRARVTFLLKGKA